MTRLWCIVPLLLLSAHFVVGDPGPILWVASPDTAALVACLHSFLFFSLFDSCFLNLLYRLLNLGSLLREDYSFDGSVLFAALEPNNRESITEKSEISECK